MRFRVVIVALLVALGTGPAEAKQLVISISEHSQEMTVMVDGQEEYVWPVSTGVASYATPSGTYKPFRMEEFHFSQEWDDAPMPHSIFFTRLGHAIHGTEHVDKLGNRASHGCVRLDPDSAATLFALVQDVGMPNTTVVVSGRPGKRANTTAATKRSARKKITITDVLEARAQGADTMAIVEDEADMTDAKQQLWPYERVN